VLSHAARESRRAIRILRLYKHQLVIFANAHPLAKPAAFARAEVLFAGYLKLFLSLFLFVSPCRAVPLSRNEEFSPCSGERYVY